MYTGTVVKESLEDADILKKVEVVSVITTNDENESDRWHIQTCKASREIIEEFKDVLHQGWYCHFWNNDELIIVFRNKLFSCQRVTPSSTEPAIVYGISQGIPKEQLDFLVVA